MSISSSMLPVSLCCPFFIAPSVFSNVYLLCIRVYKLFHEMVKCIFIASTQIAVCFYIESNFFYCNIYIYGFYTDSSKINLNSDEYISLIFI